jgi:Uma2 family endonuclease
VACIGQNRYDAIGKWLEGAPELAIEVKSPSNTKAEMHDKAMTTLAGSGAVEFWIVDLETRTVTVHSKGSGMCVYRGDALVPVPLFSGCLCTASDLFVGF